MATFMLQQFKKPKVKAFGTLGDGAAYKQTTPLVSLNTNGVIRTTAYLCSIRRYSPESGGPGCFFSIPHFPTSDPKEQNFPADVGSLPGSSA